MKISFITTVRHNVGDDFVREGLKFLISKTLPTTKLEFYNIHKHIPATSRFGFGRLRNLVWSERIEKYLPVFPALDKVMKSDILIQSGAPLYWYHKGGSNSANGIEWYEPLVLKRFLNQEQGIL
jgi:hypothetical protein